MCWFNDCLDYCPTQTGLIFHFAIIVYSCTTFILCRYYEISIWNVYIKYNWIFKPYINNYSFTFWLCLIKFSSHVQIETRRTRTWLLSLSLLFPLTQHSFTGDHFPLQCKTQLKTELNCLHWAGNFYGYIYIYYKIFTYSRAGTARTATCSRRTWRANCCDSVFGLPWHR